MQEAMGGLVLRDSQLIFGDHADIKNKNKKRMLITGHKMKCIIWNMWAGVL